MSIYIIGVYIALNWIDKIVKIIYRGQETPNSTMIGNIWNLTVQLKAEEFDGLMCMIKDEIYPSDTHKQTQYHILAPQHILKTTIRMRISYYSHANKLLFACKLVTIRMRIRNLTHIMVISICTFVIATIN